MALLRTHQYRPTVTDYAELQHVQDAVDNINNLKDYAVDNSTGEIFTNEIVIGVDFAANDSRAIVFKQNSPALDLYMAWDPDDLVFKFFDDEGDLQKLRIGDGAEDDQAVTKGQLDTAQSTLQSNIDNLVIFETGDIMTSSRSSKAGWVLMCGRTIGSASSGATERANADCEALFKHLWGNFADAEATVTGGRGASADADWAANKKIKVPPANGKALIGLDNMGGTSANVVTSASTNGAKASVMGGSGGAETHTLTVPEIPSHSHSQSVAGGGTTTGLTTTGSNRANTIPNTGSTGGDGAHNNMPPFMAYNVFMKL